MTQRIRGEATPSSSDWLELHTLILGRDVQSVKNWFQARSLSAEARKQWPLESYWPLQSAASSGDLAVFNALLPYGFDPHERSFFGPSLALAAAGSGNIEMIDRLSALGVSPTASDGQYEDDNLLHFAAQIPRNNSSMIRYLIGKGADPNEKNAFGETPLHRAASTGSRYNIRALLESGASVNARSPGCGSPLRCAIISNKTDADVLDHVGTLCDAGATCDSNRHSHCEFRIAIYQKSIPLITLLLRKNFCISTTGYETKSTPLYYVASMNDREAREHAVDILMAAGYDIRSDFKWINDDLCYPQHDVGNEHLKKQLMCYATNPRTLRQLSCFTIRRQLGHSLPTSMNSLPIPDVLKDLVNLKYVLE